jgi:predicted short-subunit dehydrogenase-like oxidoreductase (DUF2520 family)
VDSIAIVGAGRLGHALTRALTAAGHTVSGPLRRGETPDGAGIVVLCVPDGEIAAAAAAIDHGPLVGHCSGATTLDPITETGHEAFSLHPLMTVPADAPAVFAGAAAAVAGSTERALEAALALAAALELQPVEVADADRAAYHAAAAMASNFLVTIEGAAEQIASTAGVGREALVPLVRASVENWARLGAADALTGPIARGDEATVARHRETIGERAPGLLGLYDALAAATRDLAGAAA